MPVVPFEKLLTHLEPRLKQALPGTSAHEPMRAIPVGERRPRFTHADPPRPGSVLILLYPQHDRILFPLIKRPDYPGLHSGQVSFPGGKTEAGENQVETALREGQEEIGIDPASIKILGQLTDFFVIPSNYMVTPVVGYSTEAPRFSPDPFEVARILQGDLLSLLPQGAIQRKQIRVGDRFDLDAPHFLIENEIVWGATAMMLNEFRTILKEILD